MAQSRVQWSHGNTARLNNTQAIKCMEGWMEDCLETSNIQWSVPFE